MKGKKLKIREEKGQAAVEFALVLPLFLLIIMAIIDFGWLYFNQLSVENAAHNAARIACVDYSDIGYYYVNGSITTSPTGTVYTVEETQDESGTSTYTVTTSTGVDCTDTENTLLVNAKNTLVSNLKNVQVTIVYTTDAEDGGLDDRPDGDVEVTVQCDLKVLTPVLGVFSDNMTRTLSSTSVYKVETNGTTTTTDVYHGG